MSIVKSAHEWLKTHDKRDDYYTGDFAEAVIAQDAVIQKLKAALGEAIGQWNAHDRAGLDAARIAELRRLL